MCIRDRAYTLPRAWEISFRPLEYNWPGISLKYNSQTHTEMWRRSPPCRTSGIFLYLLLLEFSQWSHTYDSTCVVSLHHWLNIWQLYSKLLTCSRTVLSTVFSHMGSAPWKAITLVMWRSVIQNLWVSTGWVYSYGRQRIIRPVNLNWRYPEENIHLITVFEGLVEREYLSGRRTLKLTMWGMEWSSDTRQWRTWHTAEYYMLLMTKQCWLY